MTPSRTRTAVQDRPSLWAVALLVASSGFALFAIALLSTGYGIG